MKMTRRHALALMASAAVLPIAGKAMAATYPDKAVKLIVPYPPGGASDVTARILSDYLGKTMKAPFIVENRPGANGNIAAEYVASSAADGYTLLLANVGPNAISQSIYDKLPYDSVKSFEPIVQTTLVPIVLVVGPQVKAKTMKELLAELKANPGKYTYGSAGSGSSNHLAGALFASMAGVDILHIPYKGDTPALTDVMGGQISMMFTTVVAAMPHIKSGKVRVLGIATDQKVPALPGIPTISESGVTGFDAASWGGLVAPAGTPAEIVQALYLHTADALKKPEIKQKLADLGAEVVDSSPAKFKAYIQSETEKWGKVARENHIHAG
jgi:tripartite-type tricarboxylate transporter receptor subunit TctC